jgi:hypothetical protein
MLNPAENDKNPSVEQRIKDKMLPGEELDHDDFESLILDGEQIFNLTAGDKAFMEKF